MGTILFVDDEPSVLKALQREFADTDHQVFVGTNAEEGLKIMESENIDILVSDHRMPSVDGLEFLRRAKKQFPAIQRVILSGSIQSRVALKALSSGLATDYIPKPWDIGILQRKIDHLLRIRQMLKGADLLEIINSIETLPTLPAVYDEFSQAVEKERPDNELALIITNDVAFSAKLLNIAHSAFYHLDKDLSVARALACIGNSAVKELLLITSLIGNKTLDNNRLEYLRDVSVHSGIVAYSLSEIYKIMLKKPLPERFSSIGILHDIGKIIMMEHLHDRFNAVMAYMSAHPGSDFYGSEIALGYAGTTHAEIGAFFLDMWNLPRSSIEICLYHHTYEKFDHDFHEALQACRLANMMANRAILGFNPSTEDIACFSEGCSDQDRLEDLIITMKEKWDDTRE
jgi:HD-like signal output (HDOD) protein/CheY-like chemotaxis protein